MYSLSESDVSRIEMRVRKIEADLRQLQSGSFSVHHWSAGRLGSQVRLQEQKVSDLRSALTHSAGSATSGQHPAAEAEQRRLQDEIPALRHKQLQRHSQRIRLEDELRKLNTEKLRRLAADEHEARALKTRQQEAERELYKARLKRQRLKVRRVKTESQSEMVKRVIIKKKRLLAAKEKNWYGLSVAKQRGSLTDARRQKQEETLATEIKTLKREIDKLHEESERGVFIKGDLDVLRAEGKEQHERREIVDMEIEEEKAKEEENLQRARHTQFLEECQKRTGEIEQERSRLEEEERAGEQDLHRKEVREKALQMRQTSGSEASDQTTPEQLQEAERQLSDLQQAQEVMKSKEQIKRQSEMEINRLEIDIRQLEEGIPSLDLNQMAYLRPRILRLTRDFDQIKRAVHTFHT
jgi:DNA repair exonuclease SbcCD ATPase subunit